MMSDEYKPRRQPSVSQGVLTIAIAAIAGYAMVNTSFVAAVALMDLVAI